MLLETEGDLWTYFREGNDLAYKRLYELYAGPLYNYGCRFSDDHQFVKDCLHDLFTKLWANRATLGPAPSVKNYLYKAFRNTLLKKQPGFHRMVPHENAATLADGATPGRDETIIQQEHREAAHRQVQQCISRLTRKQQEVIFLRFYEDRSYAEIAAITNVSVKAVYHTMARALQTLKEESGTGRPDLALLLLVSIELAGGMAAAGSL